jgi:hypothetical protein
MTVDGADEKPKFGRGGSYSRPQMEIILMNSPERIGRLPGGGGGTKDALRIGDEIERTQWGGR